MPADTLDSDPLPAASRAREGESPEIKTLLVSEIFPPRIGGSGTWLWEIYSRLQVSRYAVLAGGQERSEAFDRETALDITRADLTSSTWSPTDPSGARYYAGLCRRIRRVARDRSASRVQCARVMPEGIAAYLCLRMFGLPYSCFVHGEDITLAAEGRESRFLVHRVLNAATRLICNSYNTERLLRAHWKLDHDRISVMHPGVDTTRFTPAQDVEEVRARLGWPSGKTVLTVSRLEERKGHDRMIDAMALVRKTMPEARYVIVGDGPEADRLARQVDRLDLHGCVVIRPPASDEQLPDHYQACDLFILPNRTVGSSVEGFGIVLLEAQACGKVVIAGDSGGTAETMQPGVTGTVLNATSPSTIADEVVRLLVDDDLRERMGAKGRALMRSDFDWSSLAGRAAAVFDLP